jgi:hypothetical protein
MSMIFGLEQFNQNLNLIDTNPQTSVDYGSLMNTNTESADTSNGGADNGNGTNGDSEPDSTTTDTDSGSNVQGFDDASDTDDDCSGHVCPNGESVITYTNADGSVSCSCGDAGGAVKALGLGLGAIALAGLATTGILVYGAYRIIRG